MLEVPLFRIYMTAKLVDVTNIFLSS